MPQPGLTFDGGRLRDLRLLRGLTQSGLEALSGVSDRQISRLERGVGGHPQPGTVAALAGALGVTTQALFAGSTQATAVGPGVEAEHSPAGRVVEVEGEHRAHAASVTAQAGSRGRSESPPADVYRPYPRELIDRLEALTVQRFKCQGHAAPLETKIHGLVRELDAYRPPRVGDHVLGNELIEVIGAGNFGNVFRASPLDGGPDVAIKVIQHGKLGLHLTLRAFRSGVRAMRHLNDIDGRPDSVVRLIDVDESRTAFSMEYMEKLDLTRVVGGWSMETKLAAFRTVCQAVEFAHSHGVLHRDIKPANILVGKRARPVLGDFDISDLLSAGTLSAQETGTLFYAAPEQLARQGTRAFSADVYSLGRLLLFLLLGRDPDLQTDRIATLDDVPVKREHRGLVRIIRKCTARDPQLRYQRVTDLLRDFERCDRRGVGMARPSGVSRYLVGALAGAAAAALISHQAWAGFGPQPASPGTTLVAGPGSGPEAPSRAPLSLSAAGRPSVDIALVFDGDVPYTAPVAARLIRDLPKDIPFDFQLGAIDGDPRAAFDNAFKHFARTPDLLVTVGVQANRYAAAQYAELPQVAIGPALEAGPDTPHIPGVTWRVEPRDRLCLIQCVVPSSWIAGFVYDPARPIERQMLGELQRLSGTDAFRGGAPIIPIPTTPPQAYRDGLERAQVLFGFVHVHQHLEALIRQHPGKPVLGMGKQAVSRGALAGYAVDLDQVAVAALRKVLLPYLQGDAELADLPIHKVTRKSFSFNPSAFEEHGLAQPESCICPGG